MKMENRGLVILAIAIVIFAVVGGSAQALDYTHIWIDQGTGINHPDTNGTPDEPFKSITYALARADYLGWAEPWHVHIGPGVYDADPNKPAPEREIFPIELRQDMIFEAGDITDPNTAPNDPGSRIIDGQHLVEGFASLLYGNDLTGIEIRGLTFQNMDYSTGNGGAIELVECSGLIESCIVQNCSALSGGGLWLSPRSTPVPFDFIACSFIGNSAVSRGGGGVYVGGTLTGDITDCRFTGNSAKGDWYNGGGGGGLQIFGGLLNGNINGCSFTNNSTAFNSNGAGFCVWDSVNGDITNCSFTGNSAPAGNSNGGGFYVKGILTGDITDCSFSHNSVTGSNSSGGGFRVPNLNGAIIGCSFTSNSARNDGGAVNVYNTLNGSISGCNITENSAGGKGGGFYVGALSGDVNDCEFFDNSSGSGGIAVSLFNTFGGKMDNCIFSGHEGAAVRLESDSSTTATIRSCLFVAPETLGEVSGWGVRTSQKTIISNNTIVGPGLGTPAVLYLPSAIYIEFNTQAETGQIFNNIITDTQCAIHVDAAVDMPITYNQFYNVNEIVCQGEQGIGNDIWWLEYNLSNFRHNDYGDPLFFAYDSVYHIQETSPCVDAGDPNYVAEPNETDIDSQPRIDIDTVDIGADEYYTYTLTADINHNGIVDFIDFAVLASYWQQDEPLVDIAPPGGDGIVNFLDLEILVDEWLLTEPWY